MAALGGKLPLGLEAVGTIVSILRSVGSSAVPTGCQEPINNPTASVDNFVKTLTPGSVALFHFSGHGMQVDQENYLIPVDFELKDEASVKYDAYSASKLHDRMASTGSRLNIVILDACRNNGFSTSRAGSSGLAAMHAARGSFIAFATAPGSTASDNPGGRNGLFTGGVRLPLALTELGLIDEYEFVVHPRLAGHGPTLFAGLSKHVDLKLVNRLEFASGAVAMTYEPRTR